MLLAMSAQPSYTSEEHAAAWVAYYAQQGYDPSTVASQTQTQTQAQPFQSSTTPSTSSYDPNGATYNPPAPVSSGSSKPLPPSVTRQIFDTDLIQQSSAYLPGAAQEMARTGKHRPPGKRETVIRKGNGKAWEDPTLLDWDPKWFRLFVGDVSNDVNERTLDSAFDKYPSYCKCKVVRDRLSEKAKYGFIAFKDPEDFLKAWKEMDGKYVGNRPIRLSKIKDDKYGTIATTQVSGRKARELDKLRRNHGRPLDGRPTPW